MSNPFALWTPAMAAAHNTKLADALNARNRERTPWPPPTSARLIAAPTVKELRKLKRVHVPRAPSHLEEKFVRLWQRAGGPELVRELVFAKPRRWRFDFAHVASKTAVEIQGGNWTNGAHNRGAGMERDCEKSFAAWQLGWSVLPLTPNMINPETIARIVTRITNSTTASKF